MCRLRHTQNTDPDTSSPLDVSIIKINWMFFIEQSEPTKRWHIRLQHIARQDFWIVQKKYDKLFNISREANKEEVWSACCFNRVAQTNNVSDEKGRQKSWINFPWHSADNLVRNERHKKNILEKIDRIKLSAVSFVVIHKEK